MGSMWDACRKERGVESEDMNDCNYGEASNHCSNSGSIKIPMMSSR
jgi:hypothetical protein